MRRFFILVRKPRRRTQLFYNNQLSFSRLQDHRVDVDQRLVVLIPIDGGNEKLRSLGALSNRLPVYIKFHRDPFWCPTGQRDYRAIAADICCSSYVVIVGRHRA